MKPVIEFLGSGVPGDECDRLAMVEPTNYLTKAIQSAVAKRDQQVIEACARLLAVEPTRINLVANKHRLASMTDLASGIATYYVDGKIACVAGAVGAPVQNGLELTFNWYFKDYSNEQ